MKAAEPVRVALNRRRPAQLTPGTPARPWLGERRLRLRTLEHTDEASSRPA
jgi:hypothetical protein